MKADTENDELRQLISEAVDAQREKLEEHDRQTSVELDRGDIINSLGYCREHFWMSDEGIVAAETYGLLRVHHTNNLTQSEVAEVFGVPEHWIYSWADVLSVHMRSDDDIPTHQELEAEDLKEQF